MEDYEMHIILHHLSSLMLNCQIYPEEVRKALHYMQSGCGGFTDPKMKGIFEELVKYTHECEKED